MNKRIIVLFVIFLLILNISNISNAEETATINISINSTKLHKDDVIELTFSSDKVFKMTGYIEYDSSKLDTGGTSSNNTSASSNMETGEFTYTSLNNSGISIIEKFKLKENVDTKSTIIKVANIKITDYNGQEYEIDDKEFNIEFEDSSEINNNEVPEQNIVKDSNEVTNDIIQNNNNSEKNTNEALPNSGKGNNLLFFIGLALIFVIITYIKSKSIITK